MERATSSSWKHLPDPSKKEDLQFSMFFTDEEAERLMFGLIPQQMEDKWFIYFSDGWLRFHHSWTGAVIYAIRLDGSPAGVRVIESWVNRDPEQYSATDTEYDKKLLRFLIEAFLLKEADVIFPLPSGLANSVPGAVQHSYIGRAYPETPGSGERNV